MLLLCSCACRFKGTTYFSALESQGDFVRPTKIEVGDFPPVDPFADVSDSDDDDDDEI